MVLYLLQGVPLREYDKDACNEKSYGFVTRVHGQQRKAVSLSKASCGKATNCVQTATTTIKTGLGVNDGSQLKEGKNSSLIGRRERSKPNAASGLGSLTRWGYFGGTLIRNGLDSHSG